MKKISVLLMLCLLTSVFVKAQHEISANTFGGIGFGIISPQSDTLKNNFKSGFQINAEINGRIYRPLWFYVDGAYESLPANSSVLSTATSISTLGGGVGLKIFPVKFLYVNGGVGIRAVLSGTVPNSDNSTLYIDFGAGIYPLKFLGVFVTYTMWQAQNGSPSNNYLVAGVKFSFGRR